MEIIASYSAIIKKKIEENDIQELTKEIENICFESLIDPYKIDEERMTTKEAITLWNFIYKYNFTNKIDFKINMRFLRKRKLETDLLTSAMIDLLDGTCINCDKKCRTNDHGIKSDHPWCIDWYETPVTKVTESEQPRCIKFLREIGLHNPR